MANTTSVNNEEHGNTDNDTENAIKKWQRLSPIALVYFGASFIQGMISQFVYIAPPLLIGYNSIKDNPWIGFPIAIGLLILLISSATLNFYFFQYRLSRDSIEIRSGVLSKKHVHLPFARIQNVKIEQPIYYRATSFACLTLDTAGSNKQEAKVVALPLKFAEKLKQEILEQHEEQKTHSINNEDYEVSEAVKTPRTHYEQVINTRSIKDLVIHGLTSNRIWIFLGVLAPFYEKISSAISDLLQDFGIDVAMLFDTATHTIWQLGLYALSIAMVIMLLLSLFSIFGAIMTFYGFTLSKVEDRYIRRSGLFTKHEVSLRLSRLQNIAHKRDWLDMLLGRVNIRFEQSSSQVNGLENGGVSNLSDKIIVPSVTTDEARNLITDVYPENAFGHIEFTEISKRFLTRYIGLIAMPIYLGIVALLLSNEQYPLLLPLTGIFAFICGIIFMRWRRWGYAVDDHYLYIRKGVFGVDHFVFPIFKIQQTVFKQSKSMKRRKLCSVSFILASGPMAVPFINELAGMSLINRSLFEVETSGKSWM